MISFCLINHKNKHPSVIRYPNSITQYSIVSCKFVSFPFCLQDFFIDKDIILQISEIISSGMDTYDFKTCHCLDNLLLSELG